MQSVEAVVVYLESQMHACQTAFSENNRRFHEEQLHCGWGQEVLTIVFWHQIKFNFLLSFSEGLTN